MWTRLFLALLFCVPVSEAQIITGRDRGRFADAGSGLTRYVRTLGNQDDFGEANAALDVDTGDFSWSVWFRADAFNNSSNCIFGNDDLSGVGWALYHRNNGDVYFRIHDGTNDGNKRFFTGETSTGVWRHYVGTFDTSDNTTSMWINGVASGDNPYTTTVTGDVDDTAQQHEINFCGSSTDSDGAYASIGYWVGTEISGACITELYNSGVPLYDSELSTCPAPTAYWDADETSGGGDILDEAGSSYDMSAIIGSAGHEEVTFP